MFQLSTWWRFRRIMFLWRVYRIPSLLWDFVHICSLAYHLNLVPGSFLPNDPGRRGVLLGQLLKLCTVPWFRMMGILWTERDVRLRKKNLELGEEMEHEMSGSLANLEGFWDGKEVEFSTTFCCYIGMGGDTSVQQVSYFSTAHTVWLWLEDKRSWSGNLWYFKYRYYRMRYGTCTCMQGRAVNMVRYIHEILYIEILGRHNFQQLEYHNMNYFNAFHFLYICRAVEAVTPPGWNRVYLLGFKLIVSISTRVPAENVHQNQARYLLVAMLSSCTNCSFEVSLASITSIPEGKSTRRGPLHL